MCSRTKLPQVPGMTQQENDALAAKRNNLSTMDRLGGNYTSALQSISGLFNPDGTVNQDALKSFGSSVQNYQQSQQGIYDTALQQAQLEDQLYRQSLSGTGPISQGLKQQKQRDFEMFRQAAGQRGIQIQGSSFDDATSNSTAGIRMISDAQKRYDLAAENERNNLRQWGSTQALNRMGSLTNFDPNANRMGYLNNATVGMLPVLSGINQGWSAYMQPYAAQRTAMFNRDASQAQSDSAWRNSIWQGFGQLGGQAVGAALMTMGGNPGTSAAAPSMTSPLSLYGNNPYGYSMGGGYSYGRK